MSDEPDERPADNSQESESSVASSPPGESGERGVDREGQPEAAEPNGTSRGPVAVDDEDDGPGWLPAILAATLIMGMIGFITCGVSTWLLFEKRTELAVRTLRGSYLPAIEQSMLEPSEKQAVLEQIGELTKDLERGKYDNAQSSGVMQRLQRLPVLQWGELEAVESVLADSELEAEEKGDALKQLSRLQRAVETGQSTSFDFNSVLEPVLEPDPESPNGRRLKQPLTLEDAQRVVVLATKSADRADVPDKRFDVRIDTILRREIESGLSDGGF